MKKLVAALLAMVLFISTGNIMPVSAQETAVKGICVTGYTGDRPFERNGENVYSISANYRYENGQLEYVSDKIMTVECDDTYDLSQVQAEVTTKDLKVSVKEASARKALISVNFSSRWVEKSLSTNEWIILKDSSGKELKRIPFAYSTPYFEDQHGASGFNSLNQWSGTWQYDPYHDISFKQSQILDVYGSGQVLHYTYKAKGTQGVKAVYVNPDGQFTFADGSTTLTKINHRPNAVISISLKVKPSYQKKLKDDLIRERTRGSDDFETVEIFDDIVVEYEDGCHVGGMTNPIYLGYKATLQPRTATTVKTAAHGVTSVKIRWKAVKGISGYKVYRSLHKNSGYRFVKKLSSKYTSFTDKKRRSARCYYYKVRPYRNIGYYRKGQKEILSLNGITSVPHKSGTRPKKASVSVRKSKRRLKITNQKTTGAEGYRFYIKCGKKGKYRRVKEYTGSKKRTYTSKKLKKGKTYYVTIRAYQRISGKKYFGKCAKTKKIKI